MATYDFSLASDTTITIGSEPMVEFEPRLLWTSSEISNGQLYNSVVVYIIYLALDPDTSVVSPYNFEVVATIEMKQADNSWAEIARQNSPIRRLDQGATRQITISPVATLQEEGIDYVIAGFGGMPITVKSRFIDSAEGIMRVKLLAVDNTPAGPNPFNGVTFSIHGKRYDA